MKLLPSVHLFLSGSSLELGHPNRLGGCCCHATREGLLNKSLRDPNHVWSVLVLGPKKLHLGVTFSILVHHIVGVVVDAPSVRLGWRRHIRALPTHMFGLATLKAIVSNLLM